MTTETKVHTFNIQPNFDPLNNRFRAYYEGLGMINERIVWNPIPELRAIQEVALRRQGIRIGLENAHKRRTYEPDYVCTPEKHPKQKNVNTVHQISGRRYDEGRAYNTDEFGDNAVIPFVLRLPARDKEEVWIYGYKYSDWDGVTLFLDRAYDKTSAMEWAERMATRHADECYEDYEKEQKAMRIQDIKQELKDMRRLIRAMVKTIRMFNEGEVYLKELKQILTLLLEQRSDWQGKLKYES